MGDTLPVFKAAAVQASPVFLNREASVDKACALIAEAAKNDAQLIVLPETFIPGGPYWAWHLPMRECGKFSAELFQNAVDIPSDTTVRLGEAARKANAYVVIGVNERDGKSLYNTLLYFGPDGRIIGKHRKFKPTGPEKLVWGDGDGSTHKVYDTAVGKLGGLICGEHTMALPGYTLAAMGEQVHGRCVPGGNLLALPRNCLQHVCGVQPAGGRRGCLQQARHRPQPAAVAGVERNYRRRHRPPALGPAPAR
jgi:nitrilase